MNQKSLFNKLLVGFTAIILSLAILLPYGFNTCLKICITSAEGFIQDINNDFSSQKAFARREQKSLELDTNFNNIASYFNDDIDLNYNDSISSDLTSSLSNISYYEEEIYKYSDFKFDNGLIDDDYSYSSTFYKNRNIAEIVYQESAIISANLGTTSISYSYDNDCITISINNGTKYQYFFNNQNNLIEIQKNGAVVKSFVYEGEKLSKTVDSSGRYAYEIIFEGETPIAQRKFLCNNQSYYAMSTTPFSDIPEALNENISYVRNYTYNEKEYITDKYIGEKHYHYDYINDFIVKETVNSAGGQYSVQYVFDSSFNRIGFIYQGLIYYYIYDALGNVIEVLDSAGNSVLQYTYDILGRATISGNSNLYHINSYTFRAKDNWYFDYSTQQYYIDDNTIYNSQYAKTLSGSDTLPFNFYYNPNKSTVSHGVESKIVPVLLYSVNSRAEYEKIITDQISSTFGRQSLQCIRSLLTFDLDDNGIAYRNDIYIKDFTDYHYGLFNGQVYNLINIHDANGNDKRNDYLSRLNEQKTYSSDAENTFIPSEASILVKGHFIQNGMYIKYYSDSESPSIVNYEVSPVESSTYDYSFGNLYDYDTESFVLYFGPSEIDEDMTIVNNISESIDYEAIAKSIEEEINADSSLGYEVSEVAIFYISPEYIEYLTSVQFQDAYFGGYSAEQLRSQFGDDWSFTYYNGNVVHTSQLPPELQAGSDFDWGAFFVKVAKGAGCILIAATVTAVTGGAGLACFAATAATLAGISAAGGIVGGTVKAISTNSWEGFAEGFADGFEFTAIVSSQIQMAGVSMGVSPISACFVAGTPVLTAQGSTPIEDVKVGDRVLSYDFGENRVESKKVKNTFVNQSSELYCLSFGNEHIKATPNHPFYVIDKGWTSASQLTTEDVLLDSSGTAVRVDQIEYIRLSEPVNVYNFEVEDNHNYFIGKSCILVHNDCATPVLNKIAGEAINISGASLILGELGICGIIASEAMDAGVSVGPQSLNMTKHDGIKFTMEVAEDLAAEIARKKTDGDDKIYYEVYPVRGVGILRIDYVGRSYEYARGKVLAYGYNFITLEEMDARKLVEGIREKVAPHKDELGPHYHPSDNGHAPYGQYYPTSELISTPVYKKVHSFYDPVRCIKLT